MSLRHLILPLLAAAATGTAPASLITWSGVQDITIPTDFDGVFIDFTDPSDATSFSTNTTGSGSWDMNFFLGGSAIGNSLLTLTATDTGATNSNIENYTTSEIIGDGSGDGDTFVTGSSGSTGHMGSGSNRFTSGTPGYLGFQIDDGSGGFNNGWMRVTLKDDGNTGTIHEWAWDTGGNAIQVAAIPEPSTVVPLLGLMATCTLLRRRRA